MSDDNENKDVEDDTAKHNGPLAGARLGEARRQQQITVEEVAKELHLDEYKIRALEQNQFDVLGAPVFAKGHLKKYAQLVGVHIDDVLGDYYELNRTSVMPPVVGKVRKQVREVAFGPWIAAIAVIVVVVAAFWYVVARPVPDTPTSQPAPAEAGAVAATGEQDAETPAPDEAIADDAPQNRPTDDMNSRLPVAAPVPEARAESTAPPQPAAQGEIRLSLQFTGDCWTEISDGRGRRLFFDLGRSGRSINLTGQAPLSILLGNADNVDVRVNGEAYTVAASDRRGQTARLTIQSP